ncbi:MAG: PEP-CTERM sorting domain-containing protein [Bryobacteraceae bacterium]
MRSFFLWGSLCAGVACAVAGGLFSIDSTQGMEAIPILDALNVPEPATMAMIGVGLISVGGLSRIVKSD